MSRYKVRNWSQYNRSLQKRGSLSLWISEDAINTWNAQKKAGKNGAPFLYSDSSILCMMTLKAVYHLPYRQLVGFMLSVIRMMKLSLSIPHFTTVAIRARGLCKAFKKLCPNRPKDLVFDSSGFKIFGEGEWSMRKHGKQKRRRWKKFHLGICPDTQKIVVAEVTDLEGTDCQVAPRMIKKAPRSVETIIGDGAYDTEGCYKAAFDRDMALLAPPRKGAIVQKNRKIWLDARDDAICDIVNLGNDEQALKLWKKLRGYHKRSLVETAFSRLKGYFGGKLFSKNIICQEVELLLKANIMNHMTELGMPKGGMV